MGLRGPPVFPTNLLYNTNTTVRQTLRRRGKRSTSKGSDDTCAARDRRGRYSRHAEGDSICITGLPKFYAHLVRPLQTGLLYVLRGTNVRKAQVKWAKLTIYHLLAVG